LGLGTPEDSLSSCYTLIPKAPKKDVITYLVNANKVKVSSYIYYTYILYINIIQIIHRFLNATGSPLWLPIGHNLPSNLPYSIIDYINNNNIIN
jgi:hypothetical protein